MYLRFYLIYDKKILFKNTINYILLIIPCSENVFIVVKCSGKKYLSNYFFPLFLIWKYPKTSKTFVGKKKRFWMQTSTNNIKILLCKEYWDIQNSEK